MSSWMMMWGRKLLGGGNTRLKGLSAGCQASEARTSIQDFYLNIASKLL